MLMPKEILYFENCQNKQVWLWHLKQFFAFIYDKFSAEFDTKNRLYNATYLLACHNQTSFQNEELFKYIFENFWIAKTLRV